MDERTNDWIDMHNQISDDSEGFGSRAFDAVVKGGPLALASGVVSMWNTGVSFGNMLGADAEKIDLGVEVSKYDDNLAAYYTDHKNAIDMAGFLGTSIAPGVGGVKLFKMAQGGIIGVNGSEMTGLIKNTQAAFGFFRNKEFQYTEKALDKIRATNNIVHDTLDNNKLLAIASGVGDEALQGAAFQSAILLSMNQNPILSEADEGYLTSLVRNSHEIYTVGLIQGGFGGAIKGFKLAGKLKGEQYESDISHLPSRKPTLIGDNFIDNGSAWAVDFAFWRNKADEFEQLKIRGLVDDKDILGYNRTLDNYEKHLRKTLTTNIIGKEDAQLNAQLWKMFTEAPNPTEAVDLFMTGASDVSRADLSMQPAAMGAAKVFGRAGPIMERHAENLIKRHRVVPGQHTNPSDLDLQEWKDDYDMYQDPNGDYHVIEISDYAINQLPKKSKTKNPFFIVKSAGDRMGQIREKVFPVMGDLGSVGVNDEGNLLSNGQVFAGMPLLYEPMKIDPIFANGFFVKMGLHALPNPNVPLNLTSADLPYLEMLTKKGFTGEVSWNGALVEEPLKDVLKQAKMDVRQELVSNGFDFPRIARLTNVTEEFAETGLGDGFMLSGLEDHTKPLYAAIQFRTGIFDKFDQPYVRGMVDLLNHVKIAYAYNQTTAAKILGKYYTQLADTKGTFTDVTTLTPSNTMVSSSSGELGSMFSFMQNAGKVGNLAKKERVELVQNAIRGVDGALRADPDALIEFNWLVTKGRSTSELFDLVPAGDVGAAQDVVGYMAPIKLLKEAEKEGNDLYEMIQQGVKDKTVMEVKHQTSYDYLDITKKITGNRNTDHNRIFAAKGMDKTYPVDGLYFPPINTVKYPYVAFVKERMDMGPGDLKESGVLVGTTAQELQSKVNRMKAAFGDIFEYKTLDDIEAYKIAKGEYEEGPMLGRSMVDAAMKKEGLLYDFAPRQDAEILDDYQQWHWTQERNIVNQTIELKYAQEFAELRFMGHEYEEFALTKFGEKNKARAARNNPYLRYIQTALDINNFDQYESIWGKVNGLAEDAWKKVSSVWDTAFNRAVKGETDWTKANAQAESYGFRAPYRDVVEELMHPTIEKNKQFQTVISKANAAISTMTLGLDFFNSLVNVISFPVLATAEMSNILRNIRDPKIAGALTELTSVAVPGGQYAIPTPMKLLANSIQRFFGTESKELANYYRAIGAIRTQEDLLLDATKAVQLPADIAKSKDIAPWVKYANQVKDAAVTLGEATAKYGKMATGYNKAEYMVRFLAADMMKQLVDAAGVEASQQASYINTFVNRVHGNYLASQRPHLFQGAVGQAISLFQTYQFNMIQNMVRYVEGGNGRSVAVMLGMQNTIFGVQGNPAFGILNEAIGNANEEHQDIYSTSRQILGKDVSNWIMYGLGSNAIRASLYNRGDLTPRYATVVPVNPADIPFVSITTKAINSFVDAAKKISQGGNVANALLDGIAHFGANRPLSGLAQLAQGYRTTNKGDLMSAYTDIDGWTVAAKLAGGETLNRQIAFDNYYRGLAYKKYDTDKINQLGESLKTTMYNGQNPTSEQVLSFMDQYVREGGNPTGFNRWMMNAFKGANQSSVNAMALAVNSRAGRRMAAALGGDDVPDYWNNPVNAGMSSP